MKLLKRILKKEAGQALPMALILLALGGLLVVPTLAFMTTNLNANRQIDRANLELYSADAGVENALWSIQDDPGILPAEDSTKTLPFANQTINGMSTVTTTITNKGSRIYRINSIATSPGGHNTEIEVFLNCLNFSNLLEGAITAKNDLEIHNGYVYGPILHDDDNPIIQLKNDNPDVTRKEQTNWPTWDDLSPIYLDDVQGHNYNKDNPLYLNTITPCELGPTYLDGSLTVDNKGTAGLTLKLTGTIYVTGNLIFEQSKDYTIDLNNQTIFVHGTEGAAYAIKMPSNTIKIKGSGCIIADGNIEFKPGMTADSEDEYVLVMSLSGTTTMQPGGNFYGSLVGNALVDLSNSTLTYTDPYAHDLNFPNLQIGGHVPGKGAGTILTYTIK